jgi:hypothetical protein
MKKSWSINNSHLWEILRDQTGTVQLDVFLTFLLGLLFSLVSPKADLEKPLLKRHSFRLSFLYLLVVGVGVAVGAYVINPAWMWMYWVDPKGIPVSHLIVLFGLIYPGSFMLGYLWAPYLNAAGWGWRVLGIVAGYEVILILFTLSNRLLQVGSFGQFVNGQTVPLFSFNPLSFTPLFYELLIGLGIAVFGGVGLLMHLLKLSKQELLS